MLFNSYPFFFLTLITFSFYYFKLLRSYQIYILILSSAVFYGYSQPFLLILLFLSASINAIASYWLFFGKKDKKKLIASCGVIFNLLVLGFFKYNKLLEYDASSELIDFIILLPLPIGISFYTFQGISLLMDAYKPLKGSKLTINSSFYEHYRNTLFFISFFPQLVAGPIVKAHHFYPQICEKNIQDIDLYYVLRTLALGYFLKSVIADNLKDQTFWVAYPYFEFQSSLTLIVMLFGYSMQIFADFAGYSLIAIGVAALFGYKLPQNFNFPYISKSIAEFWGRWHISLSSWLKEYLYIGLLGGNRKGEIRTYINLMVVMFLGGLWHGAAISYGVWGLWHGIGLAVERVLFGYKGNKECASKPIALLQIVLVFSFVSFGWLFFKLTSINEAINYLYSIKNNTGMAHNKTVIFGVFVYSLPILIYHIIYLVKRSNEKVASILEKHGYMAYALMLLMLLVNGGIPGEFVYFQF